jgi:hypothetical protein
MSRSTYIATFELLTGKRTWHKTPHGHAEGPAEIEMAPAPRQLEAARRPILPSRPDHPRRPGPAPDWGQDQRWGSEPQWAPDPARGPGPGRRPPQDWEPDATWRRIPGER